MYLSKTPLRISLFGGGTDFPEFFKNQKSLIIGGTIDKYIYITLNDQVLKGASKNIKLFYSKIEKVNNIKKIKHRVIKELFKSYKIKNDIELHIASDLPAFTGLGSSSAFSVGLQNLLNYYRGKRINKKNLTLKTIELERDILGEVVGYQDQIHASYGGFNYLEIKKNNFKVKNFIKKKIKKLENNLILVFTGISRKANDVEKKKMKRFKINIPHLKKINFIAKKAFKILNNKKDNNLNEIGKLLNDSWIYKKKLSQTVTNKKIDNIYSEGIKGGALGGKLLGAGSGGFILFYVPSKKKLIFEKAMKKYIKINFKFSNRGSEVFKL